jgi:hypothetical protein
MQKTVDGDVSRREEWYARKSEEKKGREEGSNRGRALRRNFARVVKTAEAMSTTIRVELKRLFSPSVLLFS